MNSGHPANDNSQPWNVRANVLSVVVSIIAPAVGRVTYTAILAEALQALEATEEEIGIEVMDAVHLLCRKGLFVSPDLYADHMEFGAWTTVSASKAVTSFIHDDDYAGGDGPEAA